MATLEQQIKELEEKIKVILEENPVPKGPFQPKKVERLPDSFSGGW